MCPAPLKRLRYAVVAVWSCLSGRRASDAGLRMPDFGYGDAGTDLVIFPQKAAKYKPGGWLARLWGCLGAVWALAGSAKSSGAEADTFCYGLMPEALHLASLQIRKPAVLLY